MKCTKCGTEYEGKFCPECGQPSSGAKVTCKSCGSEFTGSFCPNCGTAVNAQPSQAQAPQVIIQNTNMNTNTNTNANIVPNVKVKNKWVSLLLCVFLGLFGAHKFYEEKILLGLVYLFTGGLFFVGVIIDFFALLFKPNPYTV